MQQKVCNFTLFIAFLLWAGWACKEEKPALPTNGLTAFLTLDRNAKDESQNGHDAIANGAPNYTNGAKVGSAMQFDGVDDYLEIPNGLNFQADFTICFWVKTDVRVCDQAAMTLFLKGEACPDGNPNFTGQSYELSIGPKRNACSTDNSTCDFLRFLLWKDGGNFRDPRIVGGTNFNAIEPGKWAFVCWQFDATAKKAGFYINGKKLADSEEKNVYEEGSSVDCKAITAAAFSKLHQTQSTLKIGVTEKWCGRIHAYDNYFKGALDNIRFYNRLLTEEEVTILFEE